MLKGGSGANAELEVSLAQSALHIQSTIQHVKNSITL